ncbi:RagB/SusD family nutrient uptake outer membrane protein [Filimonas effusa]|uniref:RagB/SusD family nutrient uptake outer membrane protein n=1 Tax=Filimonas effusa TaxID=2508721 RepID=A0A4Q1D7D8_9BACT|nr:RagB/SusD family nutrient uptake outer membrane protein [Filimonas effusa]RXK83607.1 RagB/SusD family nutrient uptake outer membrane protein [Filimonas effusa]
MKKYICFLSIMVLLLSSCNKYLDIEPKGVRLLETTRDYDEWLNNIELENSVPSQLNMLDDCKDLLTISSTLTSSNDRIYTWQEQFVEEVPGSALIWQTLYKSIYLYNTVINNIEKVTDGTVQDRNSLKGEALLGRAFEYLYLVNLYAKVYDKTTADKDLAVPFVTSVDVTDVMPGRSTVQQIYDQIITDIKTAIPDLPKENASNRFRGTVAAAYGVLARTYLYMGNYSEAARNAQLALDNGTAKVLDYTALPDAKSIPHVMKRADAIYARLGGTSYLGSEIPVLSFLRSFDTKDLRLKFYYTQLGDYSFTVRGRTLFMHAGVPSGYAAPSWGISVAEMYLVIAEAAARNNDLTKACDQLDSLRKRRFPTASYQKFTSTDQEQVLQKVIAERSFELAFCGMRWFDMRRYDAEGRMPAVERYNGTGSVIATLQPGSPRYVLRIPLQVMYFNPTWEQNP